MDETILVGIGILIATTMVALKVAVLVGMLFVSKEFETQVSVSKNR